MKTIRIILYLTAIASLPVTAQEPIKNPLIDYAGFERIVTDSKTDREVARLTEDQFLTALKSGDYILLDARSERNYRARHIAGAINLPFTEFSAEALARIIPGKKSKILIYCNNNFLGDPVFLVSKTASASLNVNTQASLRAYGYHVIYELGPLLNIHSTKLPFSGTAVEKSK